MIEDTIPQTIKHVIVDSVANGAGKQIKWFVRGVWTLVAVIATSAFYVGNTMKNIEYNSQNIAELMERSDRSQLQHEGIMTALTNIATIQLNMDRDVERLKDVMENK